MAKSVIPKKIVPVVVRPNPELSGTVPPKALPKPMSIKKGELITVTTAS